MKGFEVTVNVIESNSEIEKLIMNDLVRQLNSAFRNKMPEIKEITGDLLQQYIRAQPTYNAIVNGTLKYELGLVNPTARLLNIVDELVRNIKVTFDPFTADGKQFKGGITINAVKSDYSDIIKLRDSILVTEKGVKLEWLRWLLLDGRAIIIGDYHVEFGNWGRTGGAAMRKGGKWQVPSENAGRQADNFITDAIRDMQNTLKEKLEECIASI
jgi:hypothetical protein